MQKDVENYIGGTSNQQEYIEETNQIRNSYSKNQKEATEVSWIHNAERALGEFNTHRIHQSGGTSHELLLTDGGTWVRRKKSCKRSCGETC